MNHSRIIAREIRRISGLSSLRFATKFSFNSGKLFMDQNYLLVQLPPMEYGLDESLETLAEIKEDFTKEIQKRGIISVDKRWWNAKNRKQKLEALSSGKKWEVSASASQVVVGIRLKYLADALSLTEDELKERLKKGLAGKLTTEFEYEEDLENKKNKELEDLRKENEELRSKNQPQEEAEATPRSRKDIIRSIFKNM